MSTIEQVQQELKTRGIKDIKLFWNEAALASWPHSRVLQSIADFIQAYLDGRSTKLESIGDSIKEGYSPESSGS